MGNAIHIEVRHHSDNNNAYPTDSSCMHYYSISWHALYLPSMMMALLVVLDRNNTLVFKKV